MYKELSFHHLLFFICNLSF